MNDNSTFTGIEALPRFRSSEFPVSPVPAPRVGARRCSFGLCNCTPGVDEYIFGYGTGNFSDRPELLDTIYRRFRSSECLALARRYIRFDGWRIQVSVVSRGLLLLNAARRTFVQGFGKSMGKSGGF